MKAGMSDEIKIEECLLGLPVQLANEPTLTANDRLINIRSRLSLMHVVQSSKPIPIIDLSDTSMLKNSLRQSKTFIQFYLLALTLYIVLLVAKQKYKWFATMSLQ